MAWNLEEALRFLSRKDRRMAAAIEELNGIFRKGGDDLFTALMQAIIGQQISLRAAETVWNRLTDALGEVTPASVAAADEKTLRACGMSGRKASYLKENAKAVTSGRLDLSALEAMDDEAVISQLVTLRGVGRWTAEMLLIFSLQRQNVMSFDDLGVRNGLCLLYHHKKMTKALFARYQKRFSPYGTAASLVLWEIAGGRTPKACAMPIRTKPSERCAAASGDHVCP